jgi:hypothetical protein
LLFFEKEFHLLVVFFGFHLLVTTPMEKDARRR